MRPAATQTQPPTVNPHATPAQTGGGGHRWRAAAARVLAAGAAGVEVAPVAQALGVTPYRATSVLCHCRDLGRLWSLWLERAPMLWFASAAWRDEALARLRQQGQVAAVDSPMAQAGQGRRRQPRLAPLLDEVARAGVAGISSKRLAAQMDDMTVQAVTRLMCGYRTRGHVWSATDDDQQLWFARREWALDCAPGGACGVGVGETGGRSAHRRSAQRAARLRREQRQVLAAARAMVPPTPASDVQVPFCSVASPRAEVQPPRKGARGQLPPARPVALPPPVVVPVVPVVRAGEAWARRPAVNAGEVVPVVVPSPAVDPRYQVDPARFEGGELMAAWRAARAASAAEA